MAGRIRKRLDAMMVEKGLVQSRDRARALILAGKVQVNGLRVDKAGAQIAEDARIETEIPDFPYVSRGALKLKAALDQLSLNPEGMVCMDVGASTGGFTDLLLRQGASRVVAVDVGYGQLAWSLRQDSRVLVLERTNIRHLTEETLDIKVDLVTIDTSFISLRLVIPACRKFLKEDARILALVKPQFEAGKEEVGKGGVVRNPDIHAKVLKDLEIFLIAEGFFVGGAIASPIQGPKGNQEFILPMWTRAETKQKEETPEFTESLSGFNVCETPGASLPSGSHEGDV
ncbi:23S rRNA (cytidine1920-2'-O)/16S rRNA (cytidine1409-2'-O)-methyltransferase [Desulfobotulus alkaliphilus]|uniref:23S rRNA (Cytidine1920-2'-O)/16S rRNA (Cytidine1409-2'-O)-methyltransferase n=1 Tax=Desulfobotulus alkaliphilus TaxID=622671 RepID=A0A562RYY7_9BACT|nr:TlyA family RNA methyltransferase [Desulfobotulus alkaliphilus]TWI74322.1 23S rRNA (cytidine1920-2'-O)/16S rRNA (cytidine1409-2'-O)-methyltransferase [Desulfobotulus alkaliphilus]